MHDLYHPRIFELAGDIAHLGRLERPHGSATRHSKICGSTVTVDVAVQDGRVSDAGIEVEACALGQASAAVLAENLVGATRVEIESARDGLRAMLKEGAAPPQGRFWELRHLEGVRHYPARHASVLLAFEAALAAMDAATEQALVS